MYVCPDSVIGEPFWTSIGYINSCKIDPDDKEPLYTKERTRSIDSLDCQTVLYVLGAQARQPVSFAIRFTCATNRSLGRFRRTS